VSVATAISWSIVEEELKAVATTAKAFGWTIELFPDELRFTVQMTSGVDGEQYILEFRCDDYKELPPYIELIHPDTGERGSANAYPRNGRSFFHTYPCICAPFNRKAYSGYAGIHGDWSIGNWMALRDGVTTLGAMLLLIQNLINNPSIYHGRMA
jgi:hypothetical protein